MFYYLFWDCTYKEFISVCAKNIKNAVAQIKDYSSWDKFLFMQKQKSRISFKLKNYTRVLPYPGQQFNIEDQINEGMKSK